jgi:hypothetical protein
VDPAEFLAARLDEDEAAARELLRGHPGPWRVGLASDVRDSAGEVVVADECHWSPMPHIARHDPARVLREVEAKREILTAYIKAEADGHRGNGWIALRFAVEALATAWSDHVDYRDE